MGNLQEYDIVAHVHDEVIIEADRDISPETICGLMSKTPPWTLGLALCADGFECDFYRKD
jgi:DNA polymerase